MFKHGHLFQGQNISIQYDALMNAEFLELFADRSMMVIGTPGIGKSMWLIYLLILLAKADKCVVLDKVQIKSLTYATDTYFERCT